MQHFDPLDPQSDDFCKAKWLVASVPKHYWPNGESVFSAKEITSGECVEILDRIQQTVEPELGYDHLYHEVGGTKGTHSLLLHRGSFETGWLLRNFHTPETTWYRLKSAGKGKGAHAAKLPMLEMLRKRILRGPGRVGNLQLILPSPLYTSEAGDYPTRIRLGSCSNTTKTIPTISQK